MLSRTLGQVYLSVKVGTYKREMFTEQVVRREVHAGYQRASGGRWEASELHSRSRFENSVFQPAGSLHGVAAQTMIILTLAGGRSTPEAWKDVSGTKYGPADSRVPG